MAVAGLRVVECGWTKPEFRFDVLDELASLAIGYPSQEPAIQDAKRIVDLEAAKHLSHGATLAGTSFEPIALNYNPGPAWKEGGGRVTSRAAFNAIVTNRISFPSALSSVAR